MSTDKQIAANRENSKKSTGPNDTSIVRYNALKHGITAETTLLDGENKDAFDELAKEIRERLGPDGAIEVELVDQIIFSFWKIRRCRGISVEMITNNSDAKGARWANIFGAEYMERLTKYETASINQVSKLMSMLVVFKSVPGNEKKE